MWILFLLTFLLPWVVTPGTANPFLEAKELCLLFGGWSLICLTFTSRTHATLTPLKNPWLAYFLGYLLLCGFSHFQWLYLWRAPGQTQIIYNAYTWIQTFSVVTAFFLLCVLASHWLTFPLAAIQLTQWHCLSATLVSIYAIGQAFHFDQWFAPAQGGKGNLWLGVYAGFGNPSYLAIYLSVLTPLFFLFRQKRFLFYLGLVGLALYLTTVRYAWLLSGIGILSYLVSRYWLRLQQRVRWGVGLGLLLVGLGAGHCILQWAQGDERWPLWVDAVSRMQSVPLQVRPGWMGYGLGAFAFMFKETPYIWVHNEWLQIAFELGLIGVGFFTATILWTTWQGWRRATTSQLDAGWFGVWMASLAASVIHFPFHLPHMVWVLLCAWAVLERHEGAAHG